ncbi:MAG TPA: hypothetical protein DCE41_09735 [Cytophagales bacterium]|nr:hypothetical protein [Cytophagales bacterium]HAA22872.1 hypothetical protein [Cytophagales bacterium]HAP62345.1 hypothetical protein [Cytophagales bacterium]
MPETNSPSSLGPQVVQARKAKAWSQEDLAEHSGISLRTIQRLERGQGNPRPYTLRQLRQVLELPEATPQEITSDPEGLSDADRVRLHQLNLLSGLALLLPGLHLIAVWLLWRRRQNYSVPTSWGRKLFSVQLLWLVALLVAMLLTPIITSLVGQVSIGKVSVFFLVYLNLLLANLVMLIRHGIHIERGRLQYLEKVPNLI